MISFMWGFGLGAFACVIIIGITSSEISDHDEALKSGMRAGFVFAILMLIVAFGLSVPVFGGSHWELIKPTPTMVGGR